MFNKSLLPRCAVVSPCVALPVLRLLSPFPRGRAWRRRLKTSPGFFSPRSPLKLPPCPLFFLSIGTDLIEGGRGATKPRSGAAGRATLAALLGRARYRKSSDFFGFFSPCRRPARGGCGGCPLGSAVSRGLW